MGELKIDIEKQLLIAQEWIIICGLSAEVKPEDIQQEIASNMGGYPINIFTEYDYARLVIRFCIDRIKATGGEVHDETASVMNALFSARYGCYVWQESIPRGIFPSYESELERHRQFLTPSWTAFVMPSYKQAGHILFVGTVFRNANGEPVLVDKADIALYDGASFKRLNGRKLPYKPDFFQYLWVDPKYARYDDYFEPLFRVTISTPEAQDAMDTQK